MTPPTKAAIIGAGGIGCFLAPILSKMTHVVLVDADQYEPKNAERQFPALTSAGNKAAVLSDHLRPHTIFTVEPIEDWLRGPGIRNYPRWSGVDIIFGAVDNVESRRVIAELAEEMGIPAILAGNSHEHGEAHLVMPGHYNPFDHHEFVEDEPAPWACNSKETIEEFPQTPWANTMAAAAAMHLYGSYVKATNPRNLIAYARFDPFCGIIKRVKDFLPEEKLEAAEA